MSGWFPLRLCLAVVVLAAGVLVPGTIGAAEDETGQWEAGVGVQNITPQEPMWMSGYGGRDRPAEGKLTDLWAKAVVIQDPQGKQLAAVGLDLVGIDRETSLAVRQQLCRKHGWDLSQIALFTSHTHTGPVVGRNLGAMYFLSDDQWKQVDEYTEQLKRAIVAAVDAAVADLEPCELAWGEGRTDFAVNRRENREPQVPELREAGQLKGPNDHAVPVLRITRVGKGSGEGDQKSSLKAIVFGYACHATVLSFYQWSGDYPGFAQIELQRRYPGAVAIFWAGCGADQNPLPRRTVELAQRYGKQLADAVAETLSGELQPLRGSLAAAYREVDLPLSDLPSRAQLETDTQSNNRFIAQRAKLLLEQLGDKGQLASTYPYPVQTWRLGSKLRWVILGGEVVVDYSLELKDALGPGTWVAGYANDVMAYIPSRRVLREGGYEGATSMIYYGLPTTWAPDLERLIVEQVRQQVERTAAKAPRGG